MKKIGIIGGGPGGYVAAIRAAQLGFDVTLIEKDYLGGVCTNKGCIPTKTYAHAAEIVENIEKSENYGIFSKLEKIDFSKTVEMKNNVVQKLRKGIEILVKGNKINYYNDYAELVDKNTVKLKKEKIDLNFDFIIIATGSIPAIPPIKNVDYGIEKGLILTSDEILDIKMLPQSLTIIGGGVIGLEFASIFNSFGVDVTILEMLPEIAITQDFEISKRLRTYLKKKGVKIETSFKVNGFDYILNERENNPIPVLDEAISDEQSEKVVISGIDKKGNEQKYESDFVLIATGRRPNYNIKELEKIGVEFTKKGITVDKYYKTTIDNIYAVGDVIGGIMLAHVAEEEGKCAVENIYAEVKKIENNEESLKKHSLNYDAVPAAIFTKPEVASVGKTEQQCKEENINYGVSKFLFTANGKALAMNETDGFVKIIYNKDNNIVIGAHIIGPHASDLIQELTLAIHHKKEASFLHETTHTHPTLPEAVLEAALGVDGIAIHKLN